MKKYRVQTTIITERGTKYVGKTHEATAEEVEGYKDAINQAVDGKALSLTLELGTVGIHPVGSISGISKVTLSRHMIQRSEIITDIFEMDSNR